ncbi:hypothetical protein CesoFtcFv8_008162 [Champsocephalus esox]|uniref:Uncharacterized protein n=1 Tax=Champsocephalus esox TaxID=159716 RepID=A0AAN8C718_9TELE|nr:hypothetical protein CesoFtcFv8_008162 [Champsocephalus esox]
MLMKTVNQLSAAAPRSHVMLLAPQMHSGKVLCACQVPKDSALLPASDWAVAVSLKWAEQFARQTTQR